MRLGDLDALYDKVSDHVTSVSVCATAQQAIGQTDFKWRCLADIHNAPTIDAIPVEWLEHKREAEANELMINVYGRGDLDLCHAICVVLEAWKKEQEAR